MALPTMHERDNEECVADSNAALRRFFHTANFISSRSCGSSSDGFVQFDIVVDNAKSNMRTSSSSSATAKFPQQHPHGHRSTRRKNFSSSKCRWSANDTTNTRKSSCSRQNRKIGNDNTSIEDIIRSSNYSKKLDVAMTLPIRRQGALRLPALPIKKKADNVMALPSRRNNNDDEEDEEDAKNNMTNKERGQKKKKGAQCQNNKQQDSLNDMLLVYQFLDEALAMLPS